MWITASSSMVMGVSLLFSQGPTTFLPRCRTSIFIRRTPTSGFRSTALQVLLFHHSDRPGSSRLTLSQYPHKRDHSAAFQGKLFHDFRSQRRKCGQRTTRPCSSRLQHPEITDRTSWYNAIRYLQQVPLPHSEAEVCWEFVRRNTG